MLRARTIILVSIVTFFSFLVPASAQNYGGISGFTRDYPIPTYKWNDEDKRIHPAAKLLRKKDIGSVDEVIIISVLWISGNSYVEIETRSGDHWVNRSHVKPRKVAMVDQAIDKSNGNISCPEGQTRVAQGANRDNRSGVARNLGGVSAHCE